MLKRLILSAAFAVGLAGCSKKLDDIVLQADINGDGKTDIVRLRRSEGLACEEGWNDNSKSPSGIYVLLGLGDHSSTGRPVYNLCEIQVAQAYDFPGFDQRDFPTAQLYVGDYNRDGKLDIIYKPHAGAPALVFSLSHPDDYGNLYDWDASISSLL